MTKHTIEIEGVPEGWESVKATIQMCQCDDANTTMALAVIDLQKTKPRRIMLEETDKYIEMSKQQILIDDEDNYLVMRGAKIWKEVKE